MTRTETMFCIVLGLVLIVSHFVGIPLAWKEGASVGGGMILLGWGLFARYGKQNAS